MGITNIIKKSFLEGYATSDIRIGTIFTCILCTTVIAAYIFLIYKQVTKRSFYNRNFNLSLIGMAVLTAAVILTIQSNIVVSLGMVGALSIVRFRTAIKDPMDLVFLFWAISVGIICGAGFAMIAVIASLAMTVVILWFSVRPSVSGNLVLVINTASIDYEEQIMRIIGENSRTFRIRARNVTKSNLNMAIELQADNQTDLIKKLMDFEGVVSVSLVEHDGDITV